MGRMAIVINHQMTDKQATSRCLITMSLGLADQGRPPACRGLASRGQRGFMVIDERKGPRHLGVGSAIHARSPIDQALAFEGCLSSSRKPSKPMKLVARS
jgi:hypothetical protein